MKVWLYYRLSRDEDEELNSLTNQRKIIYEYALAKLHMFDIVKNFDSDLTFIIENMFSDFAVTWTDSYLYLPSRGLDNVKDAVIFKQLFDELTSGSI